jgi:Protein of Unknown function (DUF2784)
MNDGAPYLLAADGVLLVHALFVVFVILGLALILIGRPLSWRWVRNPWFRIVHGTGIAIVVLQAWIGVICPLTTLEMALRERGGDAVYSGGFVAHWLEALLYYEAPPWVFIVAYTVFGALVAASWIWVRSRGFSSKHKRG